MGRKKRTIEQLAKELKIELPNPKCFKVSDIMNLEKQLLGNEITYSRMVEIMNEMVDKFYKTNKTDERDYRAMNKGLSNETPIDRKILTLEIYRDLNSLAANCIFRPSRYYIDISDIRWYNAFLEDKNLIDKIIDLYNEPSGIVCDFCEKGMVKMELVRACTNMDCMWNGE